MKKQLLTTLLFLSLFLLSLPTAAIANEQLYIPDNSATTIYISNNGDGDGYSQENPTTLEKAVKIINETDGDTSEFIISLTENITSIGSYQDLDLELTKHITTLLGNGYFIETSGSLYAREKGVIHLGKSDGTDNLTIKEVIRAQAHAMVGATSNGTLYIYNGVTICGVDDAIENDSSGHGVSVSYNGVCHMYGGTITNFCTPQPGMGVIINNGKFYMYDGLITNCWSKGGSQFGGGAIWADGVSEIHIYGGKFINNKADNRGGAIANQNTATIEIKGNTQFINNTASRGGVISIQNNTNLQIEDNVLFQDNKTTGNGGAINALSGCSVIIKDGPRFENNTSSTGYGGAIYHQRDTSKVNSPLILENVEFIGNSGAYGGAVLALGGSGNTNEMVTNMSNCTFRNNAAKIYTEDEESDGGFGGAIYVQDVKLTLSNCTIEQNTAENSGGGVYFTGNQPNLFELNISGPTKINDNNAPTANNLYLLNLTPPENPGTGDLTEEYQTVLNVAGALTDGTQQAKIGIYMDKPGVFTTGYSTNCQDIDPTNYFFSDDPLNYHVEYTPDKQEAMLAKGATEYIITVNATENGEISPNGTVSVPAGNSQTFTITPNSGYKIKDVIVDGESKGAIDSYTFEKISTNHTITAEFERKSSGGTTTYYTIIAESNQGGSITPNDIVKVKKGSDKTFYINPESGYAIASVIVNDENIGAVDQYTFKDVNKNQSIKVFFKPVDQVLDPNDTGVAKFLDTENHNTYLTGYTTGIFAPDANMTRAEVAQMFYNLLIYKDIPIIVSFEDVDNNAWYAKAVNSLASLDIIHGIGDNKFAPNAPITRAEFTVMAMQFAHLDISGENIFTDVNENDWFYSYVIGSIQYGWISGYEDGTFKPYNNITRAEVTTITNNMLDRTADTDYINDHTNELKQFSDVGNNHWAYYDITEATNSHDYQKVNNKEQWTKLNK
jgi:predicted outer membrane repeat protein